MKKIAVKVFKGLGILLLLLVCLFLIAWLLLQLPSVQNKVVDRITKSLSEQLDTRVAIDRVDIDFFKSLVLEGIYIEDHQSDTLVYARRLSADIGVFALFDQTIHLNQISLEGAHIHLERPASDTTFNYQFLIDHFTADSPDTTTTPAAVWNFGIDDIDLREVHLSYDDYYGGTTLSAQIDEMTASIDQLLLDQQSVRIDLLALKNSKVAVRLLENAPAPVDTSSGPLLFPVIPWAVEITEVDWQDNQLMFRDKKSMRDSSMLNFMDLKLSDLDLAAADLIWRGKNIEMDLQSLSLQDHSGFALRDFTTDFQMDSTQLILNDLSLVTNNSEIAGSAKLAYEDFNDLAASFVDDVKLDVDLAKVDLQFQDLRMLAPQIGDIPNLNTDLNTTLHVNGRLTGTANSPVIDDLDLRIDRFITLRASGQFREVVSSADPYFDLRIQTLETSYQKLKTLTKGLELPPGLAELGAIDLSGRASGRLSDFQARDIVLKTESTTGFRGNLSARGLPDMNKAYFEAEVDYLRTDADDLRALVPEGLPSSVDSLGTLSYQGTFRGTTTKFDLDGTLQSDIGSLTADAGIEFNSDFTNASYTGKIRLDSFELGKFLGQSETIGAISLDLDGKGAGLQLDDLLAEANTTIRSISYMGYRYENIRINGKFDKMAFDGTAVIEDPNLDLDFRGLINLNDTLPDFKFTLDLDTANFQAINLTDYPLSLSLEADTDFVGDHIDRIEGDILITKFKISGAEDSYATDSLIMVAGPDEKGKSLRFRSDFLRFSVVGNYSFSQLPVSVVNYMDDYFPMDLMIDSTGQEQMILDRSKRPLQEFDLQVDLVDVTPLQVAFLPDLQTLEEATFSGTFNSKKQELKIRGLLRETNYAGTEIDSIILTVDGDEKGIKNELALISTLINGAMQFPDTRLQATMLDDKLNAALEVKGDTLSQRLRLEGVAYQGDDRYHFELNDQMILNETEWTVDPQNRFNFSSVYFGFEHFAIRNKRQELYAFTEGNILKPEGAPIELGFNDFKLSEISDLIDYHDAFFEGRMDGKIRVIDLQDNVHYDADIDINNLVLNDTLVGDFALNARQASLQDDVIIDARLSGPGNQLTIDGSYGIEARQFNVDMDIDRLQMRLLDPFMIGVIDESRGYLRGDFKLRGTPEAPDVNGSMTLEEASTILEFSNIRYNFSNETIRVSPQVIDLGQMQLTDNRGRRAQLSGQVNHQQFVDFQFDLNFSTDNFQVLNTTSEDNELFYGSLFVSADVDIQGTPELPKLDIRARTLDSTNFFVQPLSVEESYAQEEYIIFGTPGQDSLQDARDTITLYNPNELTRVELSLNLEVTDDAVLQVIVDPITGDKLVCQGNSSLTVDIDPSGEISMFGNYVISSGYYSFNYENLVRRRFELEEGSNLSFSGDPLDARFSVTAIYTTRTSPYELIVNEATLASQEVSAAQRPMDVRVVMTMSGRLEDPNIRFDIQIPEVPSGVDNLVTQKLADLRENDTELNKQVFGLLLFNNFIAGESSLSDGLIGGSESVVIGSVGKLLTNQLNKLADRYIKGVDVSFDLESYQADLAANGASTVTELKVGLSRNLFNERLSVQAIGNVNVNSSGADNNSGFSNVAGDFILNYRLTESGTYNLRVFRKSDYDAINDLNSSKTGVSILLKKSFGGTEKEQAKPEKKEKID